MCPPTYCDVSYEINPWMHLSIRPDRSLAQKQWDDLYRIITQTIGARVSLVEPHPDVPDMVFTANAGLVEGSLYIPSTFKYEERRLEASYFREWFDSHGYLARELAVGPFEGEGDALRLGDILLAGFGPRTVRASHAGLSAAVNRRVVSLGLVDGRYYHLDVCLAVLNPNELIYFPEAFDDASMAVLHDLPVETIAISQSDADHFGANAVVLGKDVIINLGATDLAASLSERGYRVHRTDLSEFVKAGGSAKCLTLTLQPA